VTSPVRIPADVEREDKLLGPFTARQTALMAAGGLLLYGGYGLARPWMSPPAYLAMVLPVAGVLVGVALGRREGVSMDRFLLAAFRHARAPKRMVHAPEGVPPLPDFLDEALAREAGKPPAPAHVPCQGVDGAGLVHLGRDGVAAVAGCSTVNFELRSGAERQALVGGFARWLNSLTGPVQILVRSALVDLGPPRCRIRRWPRRRSPTPTTSTRSATAGRCSRARCCWRYASRVRGRPPATVPRNARRRPSARWPRRRWTSAPCRRRRWFTC
jgi:hypothetical protein